MPNIGRPFTKTTAPVSAPITVGWTCTSYFALVGMPSMRCLAPSTRWVGVRFSIGARKVAICRFQTTSGTASVSVVSGASVMAWAPAGDAPDIAIAQTMSAKTHRILPA